MLINDNINKKLPEALARQSFNFGPHIGSEPSKKKKRYLQQW